MKLRNKLILLGILIGVISCLGMNSSQALEITSVFSGKTITRENIANVTVNNLGREFSKLSEPKTFGIKLSNYKTNNGDVYWAVGEFNSIDNGDYYQEVDNKNLYCLNLARGFGHPNGKVYQEDNTLVDENGNKIAYKDYYNQISSTEFDKISSTEDKTNFEKYTGLSSDVEDKIIWILKHSVTSTQDLKTFLTAASEKIEASSEKKSVIKDNMILNDPQKSTYLSFEDIKIVQQIVIWHYTNKGSVFDDSIVGIYDILKGDQVSQLDVESERVKLNKWEYLKTGEIKQAKLNAIYQYFIDGAENAESTTPDLTLSNENVTVTESGDNYIVGPFSLSGTNTDLIKEITATLNVNATLLDSSKKEVEGNAFSKVIGSSFYLKIKKNEISSNSTKITIKLTYKYDENDIILYTNVDDYKNTQPVALIWPEGYDKDTETDTTIELTSVSVEKVWNDSNNQDGKRPTSVDVQLYKNNEKYGNVVTLNSSNNWTHNWDKLLSGYTYTVKELNKSGVKVENDQKYDDNYTAKYEISENKTTITNSYTPETIEINGTKTWDDNNNQDRKRPEEITVNLLANGEKIKEITFTSENNCEFSFTNLPKYENGEEIVYTITENYVEGYETTINGYNITNKHTPETIEINGTKTWNDNNNQDGNRPDKITVNLLADGKKINSKEVTAEDDWKYEFKKLPKYNNGKEITYTITEDEVKDYTSKIEGYNITNSYTPGKVNKTVKKVWDDGNDADKIRPEKITVKLYKLVNNKEEVLDTIELNESNQWTHTWEELDEKENGNKIIYGIKEIDSIDGYTTTYDAENYENTDTIIITNTHASKNLAIQIQKVDENEEIITSSEATFEVSGTQNTTKTTTQGILDLDSQKISKNFEFNYTIKETNSPTGYTGIENDLEIKITGTAKSENGSYVIDNINITDKDGNKLDNTKLVARYDRELNKVIIKIINKKVENAYTVKILKVGKDGTTPIEGAWFKINNNKAIQISKEGNEMGSGVLNNDNELILKYKLEETIAPDGYVKLDGQKEVEIKAKVELKDNKYEITKVELVNDIEGITVSEDNNVITLKVINNPEVITGKYNVLIRKVDENGNILKGAKFEIDETEYDLTEDGEKYLLENEQLISRDSITKTFNIKETVVPEGYEKIDDIEIIINATVAVIEDEEDKAYKVSRVNGKFNGKDEHENAKVTLEGNTIVITVKNNPIQKKLDLALRKFITKINDVEYSREPVIDTSKLGTTVDGKIVTTATYKHTKQPIAVQKGDVVTYTIRVYNEGEIDGYVEKITDHLPDNLLPIIEGIDGIDSEKYKNEIEFNSKYSWTYTDKGNTITTMSTSKNNSEIYGMMTGLEEITDTKLDAYVEGSDKLDYIDVQIKCLVTDNAVGGEYLTNIAEITDAQDINEVHSDGSDSELANADYSDLSDYKNEEALKSTADSYIEGQEDDDDFEKLVVKEFDLSLKKFIKTDQTSAIVEVAKRKEKIAQEEQEVKTVLEKFKSDNLEDNETVITKEYLTNEFQNKIEFIKDTAPFSFKYVEGYGTTYIVTAEGELTVNSDNVKTEINNSEPIVDASKLGTKDSNGNIITNAIYTYSKEPLIVETNDIITYTIRVYNEGTIAGYANEITDNIPEGLEFLPNSDVNVSYRWKMIDKDGNETQDVTKAVIITTDYLSDRDKNNIIAEVTENDGVKTLNYKDIEVQFKVVAKPEKLKDNIIKNEAQISADSDRDIDSTPNRDEKYDYNTGKNEDDIDYAPIKLQYFDLALRKFITKVNSINYNNRYPEVKFNDDGSITYNHTKDPVLVETGDTVIYTIRVYNEGEKAGYATQIKDNLPEGLAFDPNNETNKLYGWKMIDKDGNETQEADKVVGFTTNYLEKELIDPLVEKNGSKVLSYKDVQIAFIVTETNITDKILVNTAEISADSDDDVDSTPNNNVESEDDIDKEYVKVEYFDLSLKKWVTETIVTLDGKTTTTKTGFTPDSDGIAKVDIVASKVNKTTVKFKYSIKVTNEGEVPGYAYEIKDYIPSGLTFEQEDNENWTVLKNNTIVTTDQLKDTLLNPGESATVEIVLTWKNSSTNFGLKTNYAEISEDSGDDIDSTPDNYDFTEDDMDDAQILLSIKTARKTTYIGLILISITILAGGVYGIKKYVLK